jgi:hypothetical protein
MKGMTTAHMTSQKYEEARYELNKRYKIPTAGNKKITIVCNETVMS